MLMQGITGAEKFISFDSNKLCKTTGWHNNCGLNSLTHFLYEKLSTFSPEELEHFLVENPEYVSLLESFHEYYGLTQKYSWHDVRNLLHTHPVPTDQEAIFAPVLRKHLGKILANSANELWDTDVAMTISDIINNRVVDVALPLYRSNQAYFDNLKKNFDQEFIVQKAKFPSKEEIDTARSCLLNRKDRGDRQLSKDEILQHIIFQRKNALQDKFLISAQLEWVGRGCQRYANYIASMNNAAMISADHLHLLCEKLNIGAQVYMPDGEYQPSKKFPWIMKVFNTGLHWVYQEPNDDVEKAKQHNQYYPETITSEFLADAKQSGKFKLHGSQPICKDIIIADIKHQLLIDKQAQLLSAQLASMEMTKAAQLKKPALIPAVLAVWDASAEGRKYIELFEKNNEALKIINEKYNALLAKVFIRKFAHKFDIIAKLNANILLSFLEKFAAKFEEKFTVLNKPMVIHNLSVPHPLTGIKLSYLAMMQTNKIAIEVAKLIETNPAAIAVFNGYTEECARTFVNNPQLPALLEGLKKLPPALQTLVLQNYPATLQPKVGTTQKVMPQ